MTPSSDACPRPILMGCEYQPLVCLATGNTVAYEALSRFYSTDGQPIAPNRVFEVLHAHPQALAELELAAKAFQLHHAPADMPLYLNLDPHSLASNSPFADALARLLIQPLHPRNLVIELIENTCINDALMASQLLLTLQGAGLQVALDDVGAPHAMLSLELVSRVDWLKFDRHWLSRIPESADAHLLESLVSYAIASAKGTVIEGIETEEQRQLAAKLGIGLAQGFLFRDKFLQPDEKSPISASILRAFDVCKAGSPVENCA
ncbi:EAL domain-containing protein [Shewanella litorisediminis]|uniref:EAL domain-containing protein n=1 Tax=Shewanella litorisediminis TaxID=1173586 RepID=A0ABX7FYS6_9GAMM|nr:EAL domain-containing protein [Shewanella litorisediminis]MCL2918847.1 EAL domain-containing protein [Shewanella litorisediminis]QRH00186.1 EAL domain-containing protein [Shewanella litorisediminis]